MKKLFLLLVIASVFVSCSTVDVATDYDQNVNFNQFKTYAFYKPGIDQAEISDLDKKRILRAIDFELSNKGLVKSENPDLLISIMTDAQERVNIYQNNFGWGWGGPFWGGGFGGGVTSSTTIEGKLFIDVIDNTKKELIWQGIGTSSLPEKMEKKDEKIKMIVNEILLEYPPAIE
jgi:hypothetical protein